MIALLITSIRSGLKSFFSSRIEESFRLRTLALAGLWTAAMGLVWVGGDLSYCLAGGGIGTAGHWFSYKMRNRPSRVQPMLIGASVIALSIFLRNDMVKSLNGDWVPLGQYLVLVSSLAAFDVRTRGGLYTGLILSGMVLFFASQQAFDHSFSIFVVAFMVVFLAFLVLTFLEDMIRSARTYWTKNQAATLVYWTGSICAMFLLAGLAFWILPRGENNMAGSPTLAVLPYSESDIRSQQSLQQIQQGIDPQSDSSLGDSSDQTGPSGQTGETDGFKIDESGEGSNPSEEDGSGVVKFPNDTETNRAESSGEALGDSSSDPSSPVYTSNDKSVADSGTPQTSTDNSTSQQSAQNNQNINEEDQVVFYVRSKVASYWRGLAMEEYQDNSWFVTDLKNKMVQDRNYEGTWYNTENDVSHDDVNYSQTFFLRGNDDLPMVTGYRSLQVTVNDEQGYNSLVESGASYQSYLRRAQTHPGPAAE